MFKKSELKTIAPEIQQDTYRINHNFGENYSLKIVQIDPSGTEKTLLELKTGKNQVVNLTAEITDKEVPF